MRFRFNNFRLVIVFLFTVQCLQFSVYGQDMKRVNSQIDSLNNVFIRKDFSNDLKAKAFNDLAIKEYKANKLSEALYYYKKARELYSQNFDKLSYQSRKKEIAGIYIKIAVILKTQYDFEDALEYYFKAREVLHEIKDFYKESHVNEEIATIYASKGLEKTALKYILMTRKLYLTNSIKYKNELLANSNNLGAIFYKLQKKDSAFYWFKASFQYTDKNTNVVTIAIINNNIGNIYYDKNIIDSALYYYTKAYNIIKGEKNDLYSGIILTNLGEVKVKEKKYDEALSYFKKGLELFLKVKANEYLLDVYNDLKDFYKNKKDYKTSMDYSEKYKILKDSVASYDKLNKYAEIEKSSDIRDKENKIMLIEKEKELLVKKSKIKTIWQYVLISGLVILTFVMFLFFRNMKTIIKNKKLTEKLHEQEKLQYETKLIVKEAELERNKAEIELKKRDIEIKNKDIEIKNKDLENIALRITGKNEFIESIEEQIDSLEGTEKDKRQLLKITNTIRNNIAIEKVTFDIENKINESYARFFQKLEEKHPDLSRTEKKLCSLMVLNLDSKQIATLLNITPESLRISRFRLKRKLKLDSEGNIDGYLKSL